MSVMEKYLEQDRLCPKMLRSGEVVEGVVLKRGENTLLLDVGAKSEGLISGSELRDELQTFESLSVGSPVLARVIQRSNENGMVILSLKGASGERLLGELGEAFENKKTLEVTVSGYNSGGLVVTIFEGVEGFLPLSHLDWSHFPSEESHRAKGASSGKEKILSRLVGEVLLVNIIEFDPQSQRVVVSEKAVLSDEQRVCGERLLSTLGVGVKKQGVVTGLVPFGIFVRLENTNVEGLVHISELSWGKVSKPSDLYGIGDKVEVVVLSCDLERGKISLSIKALQPNPWEGMRGKYAEGDVVLGNVTMVAPFGAFVRIEEGVEGLVHVSETDGPLKVGEDVRVKIIAFDPEEQRLGLSVRQVD